jgi:lipoprotein-anchoring transpeptidase ErfK/SrfK
MPNRRNKGSKMVGYFVLLCFLCVLAVWFSGYFDKTPETADGPPSDAPSKPQNVDRIEPSNKPDTRASSSPSISKVVANADASIPSAQAAELNAKLAEAKSLYEKEEYVNAAAIASSIIESGIPEDSDLWRKSVDILGKANTKIFMSDIPSPRKKLYTIKSGDNLISIANAFGTTVEAIQKSNSLSPSNSVIFPGKTLYIYSGKWSVKVSRGKFRLYLYDRGKLFKVYKIGVGRQGRTPLGTFIIQNKQREPVWYNNGRTIPYGDKKNVLGTRWMALKPVGDTDKNLSGYGIHGTWEPETVGTQCSNGCVRMRNEDVNELFTILPYHTKVTIEE